MSLQLCSGLPCLRYLAVFWLVLATEALFAHTDVDPQVRDQLDSLAYYKMRDPDRVIAIGEGLLAQLAGSAYDDVRFKVYLEMANAFKISSKIDYAIAYSDEAISLADRIGKQSQKIQALFGKATIYNTNEIMDSAIIYYQKVIEIAGSERSFYVCSAYTGIGSAYQFIRNMEKAEEYLVKGVECTTGLDDDIRVFSLAPLIEFLIQRHDPAYLEYLDTLSRTKFYRDASPLSLKVHYDAFLRLDGSSDAEIENRLSEMYQYYATGSQSLNGQVFCAIMYADFLAERSRYSEADSVLQALYAKVRTSDVQDYHARTLKKLSDNARAQGKLDVAIAYMEELLTVSRRMLEDANRANVQELNVKFEAAQKDFQIARQTLQLKQEHKSRTFLIITLVLAGMLSVVIVIYLRNRIRAVRRIGTQQRIIHDQEKARLLQEQEFAQLTSSMEAREQERNRIARDLHDEIGSTLSSIHVYSAAAQKALDTSPQVSGEILNKINLNTRQVMENMSDIVWAIQTGQNGEMSLERKLKNYGYDLLTPLGINCTYEIAPSAERALVQLEARKNVLLIAKEAMHNIAKYSQASEAMIRLQVIDASVNLEISDNGKGIDEATIGRGNGLRNMRTRTEALDGVFELTTGPSRGVRISCNFPLTRISDPSVGHYDVTLNG